MEKRILEEEQLISEGKNWTAAQWIEYIKNKSGVMTPQEFHDFGIMELKKRYE